MNKQEKNLKIKETLKATKARRKNLACKTYQVKIDISHVGKEKLNNLNLLFIETKKLYNHIINLEQENEEFDIFKFNPLINEVTCLDKDGNKFQYEFKIVGSQIKQEIKKRLCSSIIALSEMKKKNLPTGKLKFKSFINSIPLVQPGITYKIHNEKKNYIKIQGIKGYFKVLSHLTAFILFYRFL